MNPHEDIAARLDAALILFLKSYFRPNQPAWCARQSFPEVTAVTVAVFTRFEAGKRVFLKSHTHGSV